MIHKALKCVFTSLKCFANKTTQFCNDLRAHKASCVAQSIILTKGVGFLKTPLSTWQIFVPRRSSFVFQTTKINFVSRTLPFSEYIFALAFSWAFRKKASYKFPFDSFKHFQPAKIFSPPLLGVSIEMCPITMITFPWLYLNSSGIYKHIWKCLCVFQELFPYW